MKKYYRLSVGDCVNQVYGVDAQTWDEAKKAAFADMAEGDYIVECDPDAIFKNDQYPDYYDIDFDQCVNVAKLCRGTWATKNGGEYWENRAWYFDDAPDVYLDGQGNKFTDWE